MIRIFKLVLLLVVSQVVFGQAPSNYTNINGRYRWIAGMFDSTFHIPKGTSASLRTGGSTNAGALFYNTTDSTVYTYTGTQWIKLRGVVIDTTSLSNRINLKLNISDTAAMLAPYLRKVDTASLSNRINLKLNISDTATMLGNYLNNVGYGLIKVGQVVTADSATLASYFLRRKDSLTTTNPLGYVTRTILADTAAAIRSSATSGFVPYTGANQNVNLGQFGLSTKFVQFDTSSQAVTDRRLQWSNDDGTLQFGMTNGATITQRVGLEQFARVKNVQGSQINKGQVVYISGASGDRASVKLADNRADSTSSRTLGVATEDIPINDVGLVGTFGVVSNLNLAAYAPGDVLYLDSIPGGLTKTKPQAPYHIVFIGVVERANAGNGQLFTNVQNGYELEELHNVRITSPVRNNALLVYDSTRSLWIDTTIAQAGLAVTQVNTNSGSGITGGPITTVGTIAADTLVLSTRAWRQKGIDSVQGNLTAGLALKLNISDTANMLLPYLRKVDTASLSNRINLKVNISDTASMLNPYLRKIDTASLSNRINLKLNISDTASMLSPYLRKIDTASLSNRINLKVNISDTANMLNPYLRKVDTASLSNRIDTKLNISDTATMLGNYVNNVGYGLSKVSQVVSADSATLASYFLRRKDSLTATNLLGYVTGKILADTAAAVRAAAGTIGGSGTTNRVSKFTASGTIGNSSIADSSSSVAMTILSNGNIGVNTTAPNERLEIVGTSRFTRTTSPSVYLNLSMENGFAEYDARGSIDHVWETSGVERMRLTFGGNLGVGTASPDSMLTVLQGARFQRGVRMSGLPSAPGTKALRIDANGTLSVADTTTGGGGGIGGSGTTNRIAKFTASGTIGNSSIADSSSSVAMTISSAGAVIFTDTVRINTTSTKGLVLQNSAGGESPNITFNTPVNKYNIDANAVGNLRLFTEKTDGTGGVVRATLDSSGNLGLGTTTIGSRLQVNGNAAIGYSASTAAPTNGLAVAGGITSGAYIAALGARISSAPSAQGVYLGNSGTTSTDYATIEIVGGSAGGGEIDFTSPSVDVKGRIGYNNSSDFMQFLTNGTEKLRISSGGSVFVGNGETASSPSTGIISGTGGTGTNIAGAEFRIRGGASTGSGAGGPITFYTSAAGSSGTGVNAATERMRIDQTNLSLSLNTIRIKNGAANTSFVRAEENASTAAFTYLTMDGRSTGFFSFSTNDLERMRITSGGSVGIGTTTVGSTLQVNGNAAIGYSASTAAPTNGLVIAGNFNIGNTTNRAWSGYNGIDFTFGSVSSNTGAANLVLSNNLFFNGSNWIYKNTSASNLLTLESGSELIFYQAASGTAGTSATLSERLRINASGLVFIGNGENASSPSTGIISATGGTGTNIAGAEFRIRGGASTGSGAGGPITFYTSAAGSSGTGVNAATERVRITSGGNVGIGTTAPTNRLTVAGADGAAYVRVEATDATLTGRFQARTATSAIELGAVSNSPVVFVTNETERMRITSGGDLGIGTTTIGSKLQVNGNAAIGYSASTAAPTNGLSIAGNTTIGTTTASGKFTIDPDDNQVGLAITGTSLTSANAQSLIDLAQTWNTTGNPAAIKLNITNTASGASAYLMDLQVGGTTQFRVTKAGAIRTAAPTSGTANDWKLGSVVGGTTVLDTTQWLEVEVGGTLYRVALVTLPEPEPGATPASTPEDRKISEPVKTSSQRIQELENEIQELRKMVNFLMPTSKNKK